MSSSSRPAPGVEAPALRWIRAHRAPQGGVVVSSKNRLLYPEVTGYLVPTLLRRGERELALSFARILVGVQRKDGLFGDPAGRASYAFDTGQVLRGFVAALPYAPDLAEPLRRAADALVASAPDGRLPVPAAAEWSLGARGTISEAVHLYVLPALLAASDALGERAWRVFVAKSMDWYVRNVELAEFRRPNQLTHLYGYVMEALIDLGAGELAAIGMKAVAEAQHDTGLVPAYYDVPWMCTPGQFQSALVWAKLGDRVRAQRALEFVRPLRNGSGGFYGSYGPGADYFAAEEPSWIAKFELDAEDALGVPTPTPPAAVPARPAPAAPRENLRPEAWHEAIAGGETPATVAARVRDGATPAWLSAVLAATRPGDRTLELGSGTGELSAALALAGRAPTCLDFSAASLAFAREVFVRVDREGAFMEGDVTAPLPFADGAFDVVWSSGLLEHFDPATQARIIAESARVARGAVVALVPNARSLPYRLGKSLQERAGTWTWGREEPFATLRPLFEAAGLDDVVETTIAAEHALEFLNGTPAEPLKRALAAWYGTLPAAEMDGLGQGYLLVAVGRRSSAPPVPRKSAEASAPRAKSVLAIVPNDPLKAYVDAGLPDLTAYFNPGGLFDEVVCLSPHETEPGQCYGARIVPTRPQDFARRCAELGVTVIRAYDVPSAALVDAHRPPGVPFVVSVHDVNPSRFPPRLPAADIWLPVSGACADALLARGADPTRIVPFSNRVDLTVFRPVEDPAAKAAFDARFGGRRRILCVGRHSPEKNQDGVVAALRRLGPEYVAIFVGRGDVDGTKRLAAAAGVLDRCRFVDSVPNAELAAYYSFADAMVMPSRWEGFGIVFVEAVACGAPVVTTDIAPMNEFLAHGRTALLVGDPEDADALAAAVREACENPAVRTTLRRQARSAATPFAKETVDAREIAAYRRLLDPPRATPPAASAAPTTSPQATPRVSVVLPTFNQAAFLPRAVEGILAQTYRDFELIVVDDGSTDGTAAYLETVRDPRVRVVRQENLRLPRALNRGFAEARGAYFTWTSSDNLVAPTWLELLVAALDAQPDCGLAVAAFSWIDERDRLRRVTRDQDVSFASLLTRNPGNAAFLYRAELARAVGGYEPALEGAEDWDYWIRLAERAPVVYVDANLYLYREHAASMTAAIPSKVADASRETFRRALARLGTDLDIARVYPGIADCADRAAAERDAVFDLGVRMLRSPWCDPLVAARCFEALLGDNPAAGMAAANLALAYARGSRFKEALEIVRRLDAAAHPNAALIAARVTKAAADGALEGLVDVPPFALLPENSELLRAEAARRPTFAGTPSA